MQNLTLASEELFRRGPDECFATFDDLHRHCVEVKSRSSERWHVPDEVRLESTERGLELGLRERESFRLNNWSFSQLCGLSGISRDTVNRLKPETASQVFRETWPDGKKPLQLLTSNHGGGMVRSVHRVSYTRLYDADLLSMVREFATDFQPPQQGGLDRGGQPATTDADMPFVPDPDPATRPRGTGLYRGEQDMFVFLIDPAGWTEINGEAFAPGFFLWNSEVGKRSVGIQTFWFQAVCQNHIVWDAVEVVDFSRKHTANVHEAFSEIRGIVERLVERRDQRRDGFANVVRKAMETQLGADAESVLKILGGHGITRAAAKEALELARKSGKFTIFSLVDALTRISARMKFAGERADADVKASSLLALAV
jgi:hypothetical protein